MSKKFFRVVDHSPNGRSHHIRLAEVVSVSDPHSPSSSHLWYVYIGMRGGDLHEIVCEMDAVYKARDELLAALELDETSNVTQRT